MKADRGTSPAEHFQAAREALRQGRYVDAYSHLGHIDPHGPDAAKVQSFRAKIKATEEMDDRASVRSPWYGFGVGLVLYLLVAIRPASLWIPAVWWSLTLLIIPAIVGYATAVWYGFRCGRAERFVPSAKAGGAAMAVFSVVSLLLTHSHIADAGADAGGEFLAGLLVTVAYGIVAAIVAGAAGAVRPYTEYPDDEETE